MNQNHPATGSPFLSDVVLEEDDFFVPPFRALVETPPAAAVTYRKILESSELPTIPGYEIKGRLGQGGMGVVYRARQLGLDRQVALKMIVAGAHADQKTRARFCVEAQALARLQHANVVQIYEIGECEGKPYLAFEFVDGGDLSRATNGVPQPEREAARLVETLARTVQNMHERGILHRDLKPTNILLQTNTGPSSAESSYILHPSSFLPKITDFGLAKILHEEGPSRTASLIGTPSYMSPEQAAGHAKEIGVAADIYSLGAILYELLTGRPPFQGPTPLVTLEQVLRDDPVPPRRLRASLSKDLETICLKCLEKKPALRYATAQALAEDLRNFLEDRPIGARPAPLPRRLVRAVRKHRSRVTFAFIAFLLVCFAVLGRSYSQASRKAASLDAGERRNQFITLRDQALFYGLLGCQDAEMLIGTDPAINQKTAASTLHDALALAESLSDVEEDRRLLLAVSAQQHDPVKEPRTETGSTPLDQFLAGEAQYRKGDWQQAARSLNAVLAREPSHFWAQFLLSVCHLKLERWDAAKAGLNACLTQRPDFVWAYLFRSQANQRLRAIADAGNDLEKALALNPNDDARYALLQARGILRLQANELETAAADFRAAIALKPEQYNGYWNLAHVHLARNEFDEAAALAEKGLALKPPGSVVASYHVERARQMVLTKQYQEAVAACEAAVTLAPGEAPAYSVRGQALAGLCRHGLAEQSFDQYLQKGGEKSALIFCGRGSARMQQGKYAEAAEDFARALELFQDAAVYEHLGWAHFFADAFQLALRDFSNAIELAPDRADAYVGRGLAKVMSGSYQGALSDADLAQRRKLDSPEMMHNLACLFAQSALRAETDVATADRELAAACRQRAIKAVERTLQMLEPRARTAFWKEKIRPDKALDPIRRTAPFQRLEHDYGS
jgi:serine/threonine protein kinase/tetratricopeptide (TPR) repeat protein